MTTPTVTLSSTTATALTEQPATMVLSFANGDAYGVVITEVHGVCTSPSTDSALFEQVNTAVSPLAGSGDPATPLTLAASAATKLIPVGVVFHKAGTYVCNIIATGYLVTTGARQTWSGATPCTFTVTAVA
jgi:hypothetical protein